MDFVLQLYPEREITLELPKLKTTISLQPPYIQCTLNTLKIPKPYFPLSLMIS